MTCCSATACSCSSSQRAQRSPTHAAPSGCTGPPTTAGSMRSTVRAWRCCARASAGRPLMPNQLPMVLEERIIGFSLGHPGLGPRRISAQLRRPEWGGLVVSANGVWKVLVRHGINTRAKRLALIAGYRAPYQPPEEPQPEPHIDVQRPGELVGVDCFFVGRLRDTKGSIWQLTAIDCYSSYAWAELVRCPDGRVSQAQTSRLVERVARELKQAGLER